MLLISVCTLALLALGLLIASQTALHVNRLRSAAEQIADGNLSPPARIPSPNREFSQLQDAFIQMAGNLRDTRDALDRQVEQERKMNEICTRSSGRSSGRNAWPRLACWCPASPTS